MNFNTTTKYDLGWQVYTTEFRNQANVPVGPYTIANIEINVSSDRTKISYYLNNGDTFIGSFPEDRLFMTYDECAAYCKKY